MGEPKAKPVPDLPLIIRYRGSYDYDGLLALIRNFFKRSRFPFVAEPKFKYKVGGSGAEGEFKMNSVREVSDYVQVKLEVKCMFWDVQRDPKGMTTGKIEITIQSYVTLDYNQFFNKKKETSMDKWMKNVLDSPTGLQYGDNKMTGKKYLEKLTAKLQTEIKKHLKMECL